MKHVQLEDICQKCIDVGAEIQTHLLSPGLIDFDGYSDYRIYNKDTNWLWGPVSPEIGAVAIPMVYATQI